MRYLSNLNCVRKLLDYKVEIVLENIEKFWDKIFRKLLLENIVIMGKW